jgi:EAL domain-containing protein (putative c-di-GMP-specific phosphodiesterase class I)
MSQAIIINDSEFHLSLTIGISHYPSHGQDADALLANADAALTRAKLQGDGILCYSLDIQQKEQAWIEIERDLRQAIEKQQLQLYFQPKIKAQKHKISGVEALIRWQKDDGQMVSPAQFIPVAEQTGLIITIGDWVLEQGIKQAIQWQKDYSLDDEFTLAINLSAKQFQHPDFIDKLVRLVENHSLKTSTIELEITESLLINDINKSIEIMHQLKVMGFKLSIDDFGTGYSSLSYLKQFPIDKLKIDRAFVMDLEVNQDDKVLAKSIIDLAHNLNLSVVAEGVENQTQLAIIEQLGAEEIQGFYFSKPLKPEDLEQKYWHKA